VHNHIQQPSVESSHLIANMRCWCSWLANAIKFEPLINGQHKAQSSLPYPLSALLLLSSKLLGQQPEFEYAADYVLRSGVLPNSPIDNSFTDAQIIDYIRAIKPVVAFHDFDGNEQGFRMTHLAMEQTTTAILQSFQAIIKGEDTQNHLHIINDQLRLSNRIFNMMWQVSQPDLYNKEVRIFIQGLYGNQGNLFANVGLTFEGCGQNGTDIAVQNLHGQTGANSSFHPLMDEITGIGQLSKAYHFDANIDPFIIKAVLTKGHITKGDLPKNTELDNLSQLLKSFRVGYRPPAHHRLIIETSKQVATYQFLEKALQTNTTTELLAQCIYWQIKHRFDHYKMVASYILKAPNPYSKQTKATGTGGSPTPSFLPKMFSHSVNRFEQVVQSRDDLDRKLITVYRTKIDEHKQLIAQLVNIARSKLRPLHWKHCAKGLVG